MCVCAACKVSSTTKEVILPLLAATCVSYLEPRLSALSQGARTVTTQAAVEFYGPNRGTFLVRRSDFRLKIGLINLNTTSCFGLFLERASKDFYSFD